MFSKLLCIVNKNSYENEELKLHQSLLGVKGGGAKTALFPTFSCNAKDKYAYALNSPAYACNTDMYFYVKIVIFFIQD